MLVSYFFTLNKQLSRRSKSLTRATNVILCNQEDIQIIRLRSQKQTLSHYYLDQTSALLKLRMV